MKTYHVNEEGYYGNFGGAYVPEILYKTVEDLRKAYLPILESEAFRKEYRLQQKLSNRVCQPDRITNLSGHPNHK